MKRIQVLKGDITKIACDAIVNAANTSLLGGGGVDGAIHRAGGKEILNECREIRNRQGGCKTGEAVITTAGKLPAKYVIHTVGPVWNLGNAGEDELLANAYRNSLEVAANNGVRSISFPNISTGIYRFPKKRAAQIALHTVNDFILEHQMPESITFVCFDEENHRIYQDLLENE